MCFWFVARPAFCMPLLRARAVQHLTAPHATRAWCDPHNLIMFDYV